MTGPTRPTRPIIHLDPDGLYRNPDFTQVVTTASAVTTIRVAGQLPVDASGTLVGPGDLAAQAERVFDNIRIALEAAGAGIEHVIHWTIYLADGQSPGPLIETYRRTWAGRPHPPIVNLLYVTGLAHPDALLEIETVAALPPA